MKKTLALLLVFSACIVTAPGATPQALAAAGVDYNNLIDDQVFDAQTMTSGQIDAFLNGFPSSCISSNNHFSAPDPIGYSPSTGYKFGGNVTAGKVIYDAASAYGLNPQVLLATLQKEQSLVTGTAGCHPNVPNPAATVRTTTSCTEVTSGTPADQITSSKCTNACTYSGGCINIAVGYGCPYYCYAAKEGFSNQIIRAAWLLKFDRERSEGNVNWAVIKSGWDNSDDLSTQYDGPMAQGTHQRCSSCGAVNYSGYTALGDGSVTIQNGATAALYHYTPFKSGNTNFVNIFTAWFGTVRGTPFFTISGQGTKTYILGANNTYYYIPSGALLRDYGYGRAYGYIMNVSSSYLSGYTLAGNLPQTVRFEDNPVYLMSSSALHHFLDGQTLNAYGYSIGQEAKLPSWMLTRYAMLPDMQPTLRVSGRPEVYSVEAGKKRHISSATAYVTLGSPVYSSRATVTLDGSYVDQLPLGAPILTAGSLTKTTDTNKYGTWDGSALQQIDSTVAPTLGYAPDYTASSSTLGQLASSSNPAFGKLVKDSSGTLYILDNQQKLTVSSGQLASLGLSSSSFATAQNSFLDRLHTKPMTTLVRVNNGNPVYVIKSGKLSHVYSGADFASLGLSFANVLSVNMSTGGLFPNSGQELFSLGRLVRIGTQPEVYLIDGDASKKYVPSAAIFSNYGYSMRDVMSVPASALNGYTTTGNLVQINKDSGGVFWLMDRGVRHKISTTLLGSGYYNINQASTPALSDQVIGSIPVGQDLTRFAQVYGQNPVYNIVNGQKRWFTTAASFIAAGGSWDQISPLSGNYLAAIPDGAPIN